MVRQDHAVLAARLDDRWQILDNRRSELIVDSDASSFTLLFAINYRGVQLFAAPRSACHLMAMSTLRPPRQGGVMSGNGAA